MPQRLRDYGLKPGLLAPAPKNSIADVGGVKVGHVSKIEGDDVRTGVTLITAGNIFAEKLPCAIAVGNGYGKLAGNTQVEELGTLETPIALTNTLAVGPVIRGVVDLVISQNPDLKPQDSINAVVGETNDGMLNNLHANSIQSEDVFKAFENSSEDFEVGCVGAGTGTRAFSWKGGIGTASRTVNDFNLGALVQTNYGGALTIMGAPIGRMLGKTDFDSHLPTGDGSCMIVLATDAPLTARQLKRIAKRAFIALGRTGSVLAHGSGDYAIAFSVNRSGVEGAGETGKCLKDSDLTPLFLAAVEAVEEAVYDAMFAAETMKGRDGNVLEALPQEKVVELLKKYGQS